MLPSFQQGTDVSVTVEFPEVGGVVISPTAADFAVLDEAGEVVVARAADPDFNPASGNVSLTVQGIDNNIDDATVTRAMRVVRVYFTTPTGEVTADYRYVVERVEKLIIMTNSFATFEQALLYRLDLPALVGWDAATESEQIAAMVTAHDRMTRMTFRYRLSQQAVEYNSMDWDEVYYWYVTDMRLRKMVDWVNWPSDFRKALGIAQVIESDFILDGDPVTEKRDAGIMSMTTGEAKVFFNPKPPLRTTLCREAMRVLGPYLYTNKRLTRV